MNKLITYVLLMLVLSLHYIQAAQAQRFHDHGYVNTWDLDRNQKLRQLKPWFKSIANQIIHHEDFPKISSSLKNKFFSCSAQINENKLSNAQMLIPPLVVQHNSPMTSQTEQKILKFIEQIRVTTPPNKLPAQFDIKIFFDARGQFKDNPHIIIWLNEV